MFHDLPNDLRNADNPQNDTDSNDNKLVIYIEKAVESRPDANQTPPKTLPNNRKYLQNKIQFS